MIAIVDSGGANIASIQFALGRVGVSAVLTRSAEEIKRASHVILPGVGSAETAMNRLKQYALTAVLASLKQPVLGICLGMQLLFDFSEEGNVSCLGLIPGKIQKISSKNVVPHMGWNVVNKVLDSALLKGVQPLSYLYFIHSYSAPLGSFTSASSSYGEEFSAAVQRDNFYGTQFHPERSAEVGSLILKNFLEL